MASDATLDRFNDLAYAGTRYRPSSDAFRAALFPFEEAAIGRYFPPAPARVLIGGAGGGREAFQLADRGYDVTAFEPAPRLAAELVARDNITALQARYEDLATLFPGADSFDAAIIGWASFSHLRTPESRVETLSHFRRLTTGPILVSLLAMRSGATGRVNALRRVLPRRRGRDAGDVFAMTVGLYHPMDEEELRDLAARARLEVQFLTFDVRETNWPHAILRRAS